MQIHQLASSHKTKTRKRVGRGGKKGTYSGKGGKGQTARAGRKLAPIIRELIKRYPKLKGYRRFVVPKNVAVVNIQILEKIDADIINPETLAKAGIIRKISDKLPQVKILGKGVLSKKLIVQNCKLSISAKKAIKKAGGTIQ